MDVVTLGESMVLFTPNCMGYMRHASSFSAQVGGAESNVAIGLARLGHRSGWISRLGDDEFGKKILSFIRGEGVDVSEVSFDCLAPTGLYFKEMISMDEMHVKYYRRNSAASRMKTSNLNEEYIAQAKYFHVSGITPALSESCLETVVKAIELARKHGVIVVFDPNFRRKLWSEKQAKEVLLHIASQADIVLPGVDEAELLTGKSEPEKMAQQLYSNGASCVVIKLGEKGAYYFSEDTKGFVSGFPVSHVVDPVGAGDGFAAGFLSGLLDGLSIKDAVIRAAAVGAMVTMGYGDVEGLPDRERLKSFIDGSNQYDVYR